MPTRAIVIAGDLVGTNVVVRSEVPSDFSFLLVLGSVKCRNLAVSSGATFLCAGSVTVDEAMICTASDSVSLVAGKVTARLLDSGSGAWLEIYDAKQLAARYLTGYVMVGERPVSARKRPDLDDLVVSKVIETEEWDAMDRDDQDRAKRAEYIRIDRAAAERLIAGGKSVMKGS